MIFTTLFAYFYKFSNLIFFKSCSIRIYFYLIINYHAKFLISESLSNIKLVFFELFFLLHHFQASGTDIDNHLGQGKRCHYFSNCFIFLIGSVLPKIAQKSPLRTVFRSLFANFLSSFNFDFFFFTKKNIQRSFIPLNHAKFHVYMSFSYTEIACFKRFWLLYPPSSAHTHNLQTSGIDIKYAYDLV